jgi:sugar phosphate isomerase/epimerase
MSIKSCITISQVEQARGGPFVYWGDWKAAIREAAELGFHAVELFLPGPDYLRVDEVRQAVAAHGLQVAAVGTGAGWVVHKWHLTHADAPVRRHAEDFIVRMIDFGAEFGAPAIIGSMQGRSSPDVPREQALHWLKESLTRLDQHADQAGVKLLYEPLNRYETDLCCLQSQGTVLIEHLGLKQVKLLADLFHMNIEETSIADSLRSAGAHIGHIHFVDSNRRAAGMGHIDYAPIVAALRDIDYSGYVSAEALPLPTSQAAAKATIESYRRFFGEQADG